MYWAKGSMDHHEPSDSQIHKPPENHNHGHFSCPHRHPSWGNGSPGMARSRPPAGSIVGLTFDLPKDHVRAGWGDEWFGRACSKLVAEAREQGGRQRGWRVFSTISPGGCRYLTQTEPKLSQEYIKGNVHYVLELSIYRIYARHQRHVS